MSFGGLLRHTISIRRDVAVLDAGVPTYDELGHPITSELEVVASWACRIQPKTQRELALASQAGAVVADHTIFGYATNVRSSDRLVATDGRVFEVVGEPEDAGGQGHHIELQARRVVSDDVPEPDAS